MWGNNEGSNWNPNASYPPPVSGNVDWAALAQQWIAMKGQFDLPPVAVPPPPPLHLPSTSFPPPNLVVPPMNNHSHHLGEANMDLDEEEEVEEEIVKEPPPKPLSRHKKHQRNPQEPPVLPQKSSSTIDANARKKLPPWIREGLEKMEREKQKKEQMEKRQREKEEAMRRIREEEEELEDIKDVNKRNAIEYNLDDEEKDEEDVPSPSNGNKTSKTKEELLEEMTTTLRHTLTEILLEVTSSEIQNVCVEILDKYRRRQVAIKENHQKALGQLLSGYASDDDRQSSEGSTLEDESRIGSSSYSDEESLESIIRKKKREFEKTSEKINSICAAKEESFSLREKRWIDEGELKDGVNLAHIYRKDAPLYSHRENSEEKEDQGSSSKISEKRSRSKEKKARENRRSISSDSYEKCSRSKERGHRERRPRSRERYEKRSTSRERRISRNKSSSRCDKRSASRERNLPEGSRKHKSKKHSESRERSRDVKSHRRHSRDEKRKRRKRHSSSSSSSPSPVRSSKKSRHRNRSRS